MAAARNRRACMPSSPFTLPWKMPARLPDAPWASFALASKTCTFRPSCASACDTAAPARPAPMTTARSVRQAGLGGCLVAKRGFEAGQRDLALAADAGCQPHIETGRGQCGAHIDRGGPGGCRGALTLPGGPAFSGSAVRARQVGKAGGMQFHRHEVQVLAALRVTAPGIPRGQKVVAQAEARFQHAKSSRPAQRSGSPLPCRKTCRACARAPMRGW
jgi:hypothetical protein